MTAKADDYRTLYWRLRGKHSATVAKLSALQQRTCELETEVEILRLGLTKLNTRFTDELLAAAITAVRERLDEMTRPMAGSGT